MKAGPAEGAHDELTQTELFFVVAVPLRASTLRQIEALRARPRAIEVSRETLLRALILRGLPHWAPASNSESDADGVIAPPSRGDAR